MSKIFFSSFQVSVNGQIYDVGRVAYSSSSNLPVGIVLGILAALAVGAALAFAVMSHLRKRKKGEAIYLVTTNEFSLIMYGTTAYM